MLNRIRHAHRRAQLVGWGRTVTSAAVRRGMDITQAKALVSAGKVLLRPMAYLQRRRPRTSLIPREAGHLKLENAPGVSALIDHCRTLWAARRDELMRDFKPPYAQVIVTPETPQGLVCTPSDFEPILRFIEQPEIQNILTGYLGEVPVVSNCQLAYTPVNDVTIGPQQFHRDMNHPNQLHLIVLIDDVDESAGPFTFLPASESQALAAKVKHEGGRVSDDLFAGRDLKKCVGTSGTAYFVNAYDCFHCGARARGKPRFILIVNLPSFREAAEGQAALYRTRNRRELDNGSPLRRMLLDL